jgi:4-phytase/acid phosphatase
MRLMNAALMLVLMAVPAAAHSLIPDSAVLLMRHGVRPPTHEPALAPAIAPQPWPSWDVPDGYLTSHGAAAISLLGAYDRVWLASRKILPATGCPAGITIYADVDERTVKTGEAFAKGFAPACNIPTGHATGLRDPLFSPLDTPAQTFDSDIAKTAMLAAAGGTINDVIAAHAALFQQMQNTLAPGGTAFLDLPAAVTIKTAGREPKLSGPLAEGASAAEDFLLEYLDGKPLSEVAWGRLDEAGLARLLALHPLAYTITAHPLYIADAAAGPLAARIVEALQNPDSKFTVLAGHDTNIADLAGLLRLHWHLGGYPADDPPPGGGLLFMLSHDANTRTKYVSIAYQVQTIDQIRNLTRLSHATPPAIQALAIPACGNSTAATACTLANFTKLIEAHSKLTSAD